METSNKKSYAGMFIAKLGKKLPKPKLDMKGLQISKSNSPRKLRARFQDLLVNKILLPKHIDLIDVINEYDDISNSIKESLLKGEVLYATPKSVKPASAYDIPEGQMGVRAMLAWNALEPSNNMSPGRCSIVKLNCKSDLDPRLLQLKETHPDKYKAIITTIFDNDGTDGKMNMRSFGFDVVAIPLGVEKIPEYLMPFIDIKVMVQDNVKNANILLKSLGILCEKNKETDIEVRSSIVLL